jgi:cobalt-zinc-cadmium efflux system outer membrane protein
MLVRARTVRNTTEYSYRRGEASLVEFLDAHRAFNETMESYNTTRANYARSL